MPHLLQEITSRWCHQSVCLVLTKDIDVDVNRLEQFNCYHKWILSCISHNLYWDFVKISSLWICPEKLIYTMEVNARRLKSEVEMFAVSSSFKSPIYCFHNKNLWGLFHSTFSFISYRSEGQWCGSVGRVVTYDNRDPWFASSQRKCFINY